jgi:uncharacterized protein with gpF-like domain
VPKESRHGLLNENADWALDVLDAVGRLRQAYRDRSLRDMEENARLLKGLLRDEASKQALDDELSTRRLDPSTLQNDTLVRREQALGQLFGYSRREVKGYVRRARAAFRTGPRAAEIASADILREYLARLHDEMTAAMSAGGGWRARRRRARQATSTAEDRLFGIGALVANVTQRRQFNLSYLLAATVLGEGDT